MRSLPYPAPHWRRDMFEIWQNLGHGRVGDRARRILRSSPQGAMRALAGCSLPTAGTQRARRVPSSASGEFIRLCACQAIGMSRSRTHPEARVGAFDHAAPDPFTRAAELIAGNPVDDETIDELVSWAAELPGDELERLIEEVESEIRLSRGRP